MSNSCDPMDCSPPHSSVHGIPQSRILEWVAISCSRGSTPSGIKPMSPVLNVESLPLNHKYIFLYSLYINMYQFSCSVVSNSLQPHGLQHARPPCPSPTPGVYSNSCSLSPHPIIASSVVPFSSCPLSLPASGSFQMSQFFASGGQSIELSP